MPNLIAHVALLGWVPVSLLLFRFFRPVTAATATFLGAVLLLPADFPIDLPGLPPLDRHVVAGISALMGYYLCVPKKLRNKVYFAWPALLIAVQVLCTFISVYTNPDPLRYGTVLLPGLSIYDALGVAFSRLLMIGAPFFLGSRLIRNHQDVISVLRVIVFFGLAYLPIVLWEVRMSPQLHATLYGYWPHQFLGAIRAGGFRPIGFTSSGLELALFMATATIAAAALLKLRIALFGIPPIVTLLVLLAQLVLCKSLGSMVLGFLVPALILFSNSIMQARLALLLSLAALLYPLLRAEDLFPTRMLVDAAEAVSHERAHSIDFRFENEDRLLERARERLLFGWGTYARNRVYNESGIDESIPDGYWIVEMGQFGLIGFLSFFGLLLTPVIRSARRFRYLPPGPVRITAAVLVLLVIVRAVDLLPNAFFTPLTMFLAGGLMPFSHKPSKAPRRGSPVRARPGSPVATFESHAGH